MAFTFGFYNSQNHDRVYNAKHFSEIFNGVINDGIFQSVGTQFRVEANQTDRIRVGIGRAWFDGTWNNTDAITEMQLPESNIALPRIDTVIIETNQTTRVNSLKIIQGVPSAKPVAPPLTRSKYVNQYPLAHITRKAGDDTVRQADVRNTVGTEVPFVTGILKTVNLNDLLGQWEDELDRFISTNETEFSSWMTDTVTNFERWEDEQKIWMQQQQANFENWMARVEEILDENVATRLQAEIDDHFEYSLDLKVHDVVFHSNGIIREYFDHDMWYRDTTFNSNGTITEKFYSNSTKNPPYRSWTKVTTFNASGSVTTVVTKEGADI